MNTIKNILNKAQSFSDDSWFTKVFMMALAAQAVSSEQELKSAISALIQAGEYKISGTRIVSA